MLTHKTYDHLRKITMKTHNHSELNDLLGFLDSGIDSVSCSSTFLELELEPEGRKYDCNSDRESAIPERLCTPTYYLLFIIYYYYYY